MAETHNRLLRRRLVILRWAADTREEAQRLARDLDPAHPVSQRLHRVVRICAELQELLNRPAEL